MKYIFTLAILLLTYLLHGQTNKISFDCLTNFDSLTNRTIYIDVDTMPQNPQDRGSLKKCIKWPNEAVDFIQTVYVSFIVETNGRLTNKKIIKGYDIDTDKQALKIISKMPKWEPGKCNGLAVPVRCIIPIKFIIQE